MVSLKKTSKIMLFFLLFLSFTTRIAFAVAPTDDVKNKWKADGIFEQKMEILNNFHKRGGCAPEKSTISKNNNRLASGTKAVDTVNVLVLLVDFSDHPVEGGWKVGTVADFDSILFSNGFHNPTGSMSDYYLENSYGNFVIKGEISGWHRMPRTYEYYNNGESGLGLYPRNGQRLAEDAVLMADATVDFSQFDFDNNGTIDGVILIHSGVGAEITGSGDDMWSHKWNLNTTRTLDGVSISAYNVNPEEFGFGNNAELSPIGVFCHEYGHFLGLPDLYDTTPNDGHPNSEGLGRWSLMASGNYNGNSKVPAHFDAWSKNKIGFLNLIDVTDNLFNIDIPQIETSPTAYKLSNVYTGANEYFIVENRQKTKFDAFLPGEGLLIYHIDETKFNNNDPSRYKVALEQADGTDQLAFSGSTGDANDPFPGGKNNRNFHEFTVPSSILYNGFESRVAVWNISNSDSIMTADLDIDFSRPWIEPAGATPYVMADTDSDGILEPGETVEFFFNIQNQMKPGHNVHATLSSVNSNLQFTKNDITIPESFGASPVDNPFDPIEFIIPNVITPSIDSFFLTITTDSLNQFNQPIPGSNTYSRTLVFEATIGKPNILIVDADRGVSLESEIDSALYLNRVPNDIWDVNTLGTPSINNILPYDIVIWHTGEEESSVNVITASDVAVMKQLMDAGINLLLSTVSGIDDIMAIDPNFLGDYFHAIVDSSIKWPFFKGVVGNPIGDGLSLRTLQTNFYDVTTLTPIDAAVPAFTVGAGICGVTYEGSYKSALITFSLELLDDYQPGFDKKAALVTNIVNYFGGVSTSIYDGETFEKLPNTFELTQNYPNPFNPSTTINYTIRPTDEIGAVTKLEVYNMLGRKVITLVNESQIPGNYQVQWDGTNAGNKEVASGIYFYRLTRGSESNTKKMTLLK